jgi:acyl-CoA synthetase (AMP-forming)/AMP-acid ligase II
MVSPFAFLEHPTDAPALIDATAGHIWTQDELAAAVRSSAEEMLSHSRGLVFCLCSGDIASIIGYLSAIAAGHAVALLDSQVRAELTQALVDRYGPAFIVRSGDRQVPEIRRGGAASPARPADDLAVLLSTSGTTGSPKLVRLARRNIEANAASIAEYLEIDEHERAIQSLPIHYSYGLSVLNSHLAAGGAMIVTPHSIMRPDFWTDARHWGATSFAGVPYSYAILDRTGLLRDAMPDTMRTLTQAGGRLAQESIIRLHELMRERGGRVWVMYGQTEATARISFVPPDALPDKAHTIGIPIPRGRMTVRLDDRETTEHDLEGELVYRGPNVMLGYANRREDLTLGDTLNGELRTGDLGSFDGDGFFRLTGRTKRIAKVYGFRVNLDEVEAAASANGPVAVIEVGERIVLWRAAAGGATGDELRYAVARRFGLNARAFAVRDIDELPMKSSGKIDYDALAKLHAS